MKTRTHILYVCTSLTDVPVKSHVRVIFNGVKAGTWREDYAWPSWRYWSGLNSFTSNLLLLLKKYQPTANPHPTREIFLALLYENGFHSGRPCLCSRLFANVLHKVSQSGRSDRSVHRPSRCQRGQHPSQGFPPHSGPCVYPPAVFRTPCDGYDHLCKAHSLQCPPTKPKLNLNRIYAAGKY